MKKKVIADVSNQIIKEMYGKGMTEQQILFEIKTMIPANPIEKRILQRVACIVGGFLKIQDWKIRNQKIEYLLSCLKK